MAAIRNTSANSDAYRELPSDRETLLRSGVRVVEYRKTELHAKVAVVDDEWATVGSSNWDGLSLLINQEANVVIKDADFTHNLRLQIERGVADCVPILLAAADGRVVGAVHAGWRGVVGNVVAKAVRTMHEAGAAPGAVAAAIGPCISAEHFEVGEEVAAEFRAQGLGEAVRPGPAGGKPHIDLQAAVARQLAEAGVTRIDGNTLCTFRDAAEFYSHRRDKGVTGRLAAVIMPG